MGDITADEARSYYNDWKRKQDNASSSKLSWQRKKENYQASLKSDQSELTSCKSNKINFEKRRDELGLIIAMLEGTGGIFRVNVPDTITKTQKSLAELEKSYSRCIQTDQAAASMSSGFVEKSVFQDAEVQSALDAFKNEKQDQENKLAELQRKIETLNGNISELNRQISVCNATLNSLKATMSNCQTNMDYYRRRM